MFDCELSIRAVTATTWEVTQPLTWTGSQGDTFTVPPGFVTDLATVPRLLHWLTLPYGAYTRAAVLHDWLLHLLAHWYRRGCPADDPPPATSRDADNIFRKVMEQLGVPWTKRWSMWAAVRTAALFNRRRAFGRAFHRDAPKVLLIGLVTAPLILPGALGVLISLGLVRAVTWVRH